MLICWELTFQCNISKPWIRRYEPRISTYVVVVVEIVVLVVLEAAASVATATVAASKATTARIIYKLHVQLMLAFIS